MQNKITIRDEDLESIKNEWYAEARKITAETLPAFINKLINDYHHDYNTICYSIAAAALAGAYAMESSPSGGITGFQGSAIMWEFIVQWQHCGQRKPMRLLDYENLLYPQYCHYFTSISEQTWQAIQCKAAWKLSQETDNAHPEVVAHWRTIVAGQIPFGLNLGRD